MTNGRALLERTDDHALREWHLGYVNHAGAQERIQVEINFLMRACALPPRVLAAAPAIGSPPCEFLVLAAEEVFGVRRYFYESPLFKQVRQHVAHAST